MVYVIVIDALVIDLDVCRTDRRCCRDNRVEKEVQEQEKP